MMSKPKTTGRVVEPLLRTLLISVLSLLFLATAAGQASAAPPPGERVTVYYFHNTVRCETCLFIETVVDGTLRAEFPEQLSSGTLIWHSLDKQRPENSRLIESFGLRGSDLVVARENEEGRRSWEEIPEIWELAADPERLGRRLKDVVVRLLGQSS